MYLKLTKDHTATFFNNDAMNDESKEVSFKFNPCQSKKVSFKFNPRHCLDTGLSFCFEADITDDLRSFLKRFGVEMDADVSKLQFYLFPNGDIGPCSKR